MSEKLSPKHTAFIQEYLSNGMNATAAYRKVFPKNKNPDVDGPALLGKPRIQAYLQARFKETEEKFEISQERIIQELAAIAFGHAGKVMRWRESSVSLIPKEEMSETDMKYIESITETNTEFGGSLALRTLAGQKVKALELLGKSVGLWKDKDVGHGTDKESRTAILRRVQDLYLKRKK